MTDKELLEQFRLIVDNMATKDDIRNLHGEMRNMESRLREEIHESETRTQVFIENQVSDKIRGLFDGYKAALENQALLELANKTLANKLDDMETRLTHLENRIA